MPRDGFSELEAAREAVLTEAGRFVDGLPPILSAGLQAGFERLTIAQADLSGRLDEPTRAALAAAVERGIETGVGQVLARLRPPEIWLAPFTAPDLHGRRETGWTTGTPEWAARLFGRRRPEGPRLGDLDDPSNRIWVAISSAASPLDPVLEEFGFRPERRRLGGGSFGVQPRTLPQLDPSGALGRRWHRYRAAYERLVALAASDD